MEIASSGTSDNGQSDGYEQFLEALQAHLGQGEGPLFTTDAEGLYDTFLASLPDERRPVYACGHCRDFVERHGGLATLTPDGAVRPWMWSAEFSGMFRAPGKALHGRVARAKITGVFHSSSAVWGVPENRSARTGLSWRHMAFPAPPSLVFKARALTSASQAVAEKLEEYKMLQRSIDEFPLDLAVRAMTLLKGGNLYRSEKADAIARWFVELHERRQAARDTARDNVVWLAVATAPVGFAHIRAGMLGTLLEDLQADLPFTDVQRKWAAKMDPLQYMRPQAAPTAGNIAQAEKVVAALASEGALARRFARLDDVQTIWKPEQPRAPAGGGVFSHLVPKGLAAKDVEQPAVTMTFEKFRREVLPEAAAIDAQVPERGDFVAMVTAVNPEAPPILQWDTETKRNPVNWYVYPGGSTAAQWGVALGWVPVTGISLMPPMWDAERDHGNHGKGAFLLLKGCRDSADAGIALFPEVLKSEYRPIRATLEAHSRGAKLLGREEASACGLDLRAGRTWQQRMRVTDKRGIRTTYVLDRWD